MKSFLFLGVAVYLAAAAAAQSPVFKAGVELVRLDVRVIDAQDRPIQDIKQSELEIVEDGEVRPIVFFQHVEEPAEPYLRVARHTIGGEVSTNRGAPRGHLYILIFDQQHITAGNEQRARLAAQRFVETRLRPGDRLALYGIPGPGPQIVFTGDVHRLVEGLAGVHGLAETEDFGALGQMSRFEAFQIARGNETVLYRVAERLRAQSGATDVARRNQPSAASTPDATPFTDLVKEDARTIVDRADDESRRTLAILGDVLRPMSSVDGRKTIVLFSEGFYADHLAREIEQVAAAAAQSYGVVYAVDLNRRQSDIALAESVGADDYTAIHDRLMPLGTLAAETGGTLSLDAAVRADEVFANLAGQSQDYYLVGFIPRESALHHRGDYRRVEVRVKRPGARASTRTGFALGDASSGLDRRGAIDRALAAPFPQQAVPIEYTTYVLRGSTAGAERVILSLAADLPIASGQQTHAADVVFVVRSARDGRVAASGTDVIALPSRPDRGGTTGTGVYRVQFELPAGEYLMRAVVREPGGLVGSADRRFEVRALDGPALTSGDLVLNANRDGLPVRATAYSRQGLSGLLELYARSAEQLRDARVTFDLVPLGESAAILKGSADLEEIRSLGSGVARLARLELPTEGIAAGTYLARAMIKTGADTVAEVEREIDVRQGEPPAAPDTSPEPFDPQELVNGDLARHYVADLRGSTSPAAKAGVKGIEQIASRAYPDAIASLVAALDADPTNGATAFFLGWAYHAAGDDRQAISAWRRAAYIDPKLVPAHLALADMYMQMSQSALAIQALRAGLAALPQSPELLERLSQIEQRR